MKLLPATLLFGLSALLLLGQAVPAAAQDDDEGAEAAEAEDDMSSLDEWERPPADDEPAPAAKPKAPEAPPPGDGKQIEIGLQVLWGSPTSKASLFGDDAWNLGFGLRAGYTDDGTLLVPGVRAALFYAYYLGAGDTHGQLYAAELAFDWWIKEALIVRPSIDLGVGMISGPDVNGVFANDSRAGFYFGPGIVLLYPMDMFFVGGEVRGTIVGNELQSATTIGGTFGARF